MNWKIKQPTSFYFTGGRKTEISWRKQHERINSASFSPLKFDLRRRALFPHFFLFLKLEKKNLKMAFQLTIERKTKTIEKYFSFQLLFSKIKVIEAKDLQSADPNGISLLKTHLLALLKPFFFLEGFSDPYALLKLGKGNPKKSKIIKKSLNPKWSQSFIL